MGSSNGWSQVLTYSSRHKSRPDPIFHFPKASALACRSKAEALDSSGPALRLAGTITKADPPGIVGTGEGPTFLAQAVASADQCSIASRLSAVRMRSDQRSRVSESALLMRARTVSLGGPNFRSISRNRIAAPPPVCPPVCLARCSGR